MLQDFIQYLTSIRGYSEKTAEAYRTDLQNFASWAASQVPGAKWSTITRDDIDRYIINLESRGLMPATTNRILSAISSLYNFMRRQGLQVENPCKFESRRKLASTIPNTIPVEDLQEAYANAQGVAKTMLGLLATTGIRIAELLSLRWEDINFLDCTIRVVGKGSKERIVATTYETLRDLEEVAMREQSRGQIFFLSQREARFMIWQALKPYSNAPQLSPHAIRHTMATNLAKHGANVAAIANVLGHRDIRTTQKYIDMAQVSAQRACSRYSIIQ